VTIAWSRRSLVARMDISAARVQSSGLGGTRRNKPKTMKKPNEQNACDAFITVLRSLTDIEYVDAGSPDEVNRSTPDIDFILVSSNENDKIAVEHTIIDSFDGQIKYVNKSFDIVDSINAGCREQVPLIVGILLPFLQC
jgi:hypothetical protein